MRCRTHQTIDFPAVECPMLQESYGHGCHRRPVLNHDPDGPRTSASEELIAPGIGSVLAPGCVGGRVYVSA